MRIAFAATLCLCTAGCASSLPNPGEDELRRAVRSVVHDARFTLYSPYDEDSTAEYATAVRSELGLVQELIPDPSSSALRLYLAPIEAAEGLQAWETPSNEGLQGAATGGEYAFVYVPSRLRASSALVGATFLRGGTLRHELTHLSANHAGLAGAPWFNEGLALEVESMREAGGQLHAHPFPLYLQIARRTAKPGALAELLRWSYTDRLTAGERSLRYVWAQSLFRFLAEEQPSQAFVDRARAVHGLADAALREREAAWLDWLRGLDALERIRSGANSASALERALSVGVLPSLAEGQVPELFTRAADEFALEKLGDPACFDSAATFLCFFRARDLRAPDLDTLERSGDPILEIAAQALHARRGEPVDLERARAAWRRVAGPQRTELALLPALLPGLEGAD